MPPPPPPIEVAIEPKDESLPLEPLVAIPALPEEPPLPPAPTVIEDAVPGENVYVPDK
jgi:hypothetical protein